ncbi:MAG: GNAT family N-acetyltransferase [Candidatus Roizmanbacteria bacterium]|nr:MAG: GNAT family N-acetyltransferase [Candidatus Roizmanbacteria bacterium]
MHIRKLTNNESIPWELLLLADPSVKKIKEYLKNAISYVALIDDKIVGIYVLQNKNNGVVELKNIAVRKTYQNQGIGKKLVLDAIEKAKSFGAKEIEVGTGNSSISQLAFYQKCGFRITEIVKDFFIDNYPQKIFENRIQCTDMIMLSKDL